jgi:hypothetical protein
MKKYHHSMMRNRPAIPGYSVAFLIQRHWDVNINIFSCMVAAHAMRCRDIAFLR